MYLESDEILANATPAHVHTHIYIYIYIYVCVCACIKNKKNNKKEFVKFCDYNEYSIDQ